MSHHATETFHRQPSAAPHSGQFLVFRCNAREWCAQRADGLVCGFFVDQEAAMRFAKRESRSGEPIAVITGAVIPLAPIVPPGMLVATPTGAWAGSARRVRAGRLFAPEPRLPAPKARGELDQ